MGLAPAELPLSSASEGGEAYEKWVAAGMHGTMGYMARDTASRSAVARWFKAAKSVVLLAFSYGGHAADTSLYEPQPDCGSRLGTHGTTGTSALNIGIDEETERRSARMEPSDGSRAVGGGSFGRIARYALSNDYHRELKGRIKNLVTEIQAASPGARAKIFVDTSPVLERLYGRYAGIGWVGKNTLLVSPRIGSFFFLAGFALDQELLYDEPMPDHCGTCRRCLDACPTDAFPNPHILDASKCIAYFTIEHRGSIPERFREGIGNWVFGCDACQDVCPWNRFSVANAALRPKLPSRMPLETLAGLQETDFERNLADTPLERAGRQGLRRNALLAMGNSGNSNYRKTLEDATADSDPVLSEQARWSLARLADGASGLPIRKTLEPA